MVGFAWTFGPRHVANDVVICLMLGIHSVCMQLSDFLFVRLLFTFGTRPAYLGPLHLLKCLHRICPTIFAGNRERVTEIHVSTGCATPLIWFNTYYGLFVEIRAKAPSIGWVSPHTTGSLSRSTLRHWRTDKTPAVTSTATECLKISRTVYLSPNLFDGSTLFPPNGVALSSEVDGQGPQNTFHQTLLLHLRDFQFHWRSQICSTGSTLSTQICTTLRRIFGSCGETGGIQPLFIGIVVVLNHLPIFSSLFLRYIFGPRVLCLRLLFVVHFLGQTKPTYTLILEHQIQMYKIISNELSSIFRKIWYKLSTFWKIASRTM